MNAAVDTTAIELRRGASGALKSADHSVRGLGEYSNHNASDISGVYCGSEMHSPMSMDSSTSSEKMLSLSQSPRNHSDISEGCPSLVDKDEGFLEPDMIPSTDSPRTPPSKNISGQINPGFDEEERIEQDNYRVTSHKSPLGSNNSVDDSGRLSAEDHSDKKQMVDIVGGASSPGEFFDHALEFINSGEKDNRHQWAPSDLRKSRLRDEESDKPRSKRIKTGRTYADDYLSYKTQSRNSLRHNSVYGDDNHDTSRRHHYSQFDIKAKSYNSLIREQHTSLLHSLSPDQKFFVEAFKKEVTSAAELVAEVSALRVLEMLDEHGICFGRFNSKTGFENRPMPDGSSKYLVRKTDGTESSSQTMGRHVVDSQTHDDVSANAPSRRHTDKDTSQPAKRSRDHYEDDSMHDKETSVRRRSSTYQSDSNKKDSSTTENYKKLKIDNGKEQTQALSLVTTQNRSSRSATIDSDISAPSSKSSSQAGKPHSEVGHESALHPFVRNPLSSSKTQYVPPLTGYEVPSALATPFDHPMNSINKFAREGGHIDMADRRKRDITEAFLSEKKPDYQTYSHASPVSPKSKSSVKAHTADSYYKDEKKRSLNHTEDRPQAEINLPSSLALHGVPSGSAFRKHETRRSPVSNIRSLRSNGSPDSKPFPTPSPFSMMYNPFANLPFPLGVPQSPHLAAVSLLASFNQRQSQNDYRNMRNSQNALAPERIPVHPSLRGHPNGSYLGDHHGYDVDASSYAFPNNIQEGLTPQHLKKAKLMFFYARYPNANTLKTYFPDVKFTRAITSQLIKWFSNFREFFYIQMEKFARQAITDGVHDASMLRVTRDCELFRVLNLHYNKCNEFRVPSAFLNAAEASQREFFTAVKAGKDSDPAWKKVIYKVICKLDSEIPELFKSPNVLDRLHDIRDQ